MQTDRRSNRPYTSDNDIHTASPQAGPKQHYHSYVLRCWAEPLANEVTWRFSLEVIPSGERTGFAELADVLEFLESQTESLQK